MNERKKERKKTKQEKQNKNAKVQMRQSSSFCRTSIKVEEKSGSISGYQTPPP
jgi:hypothetical protein